MSDSVSSTAPHSLGLPLVICEVRRARRKLLERLERDRIAGHWVGELSTSSLSTATAISALCLAYQKSAKVEGLASQRTKWRKLIEDGIEWLARSQNADGGFGDTNRSHSNIATTYLVLAAQRLVDQLAISPSKPTPFDAVERKDIACDDELDSPLVNDARSTCGLSIAQQHAAQAYVEGLGGWDGLRARYGKDKTFVVPIMTNCALAGMVDWKQIPSLPFEAAALPQSWYRFARMPVVSYAIPALVAIGQCRFHFCPPRNPLTRWMRSSVLQRTRQVLAKMQPDSGGYLEAVPLTSFVAMSLIAIGQLELPVTLQCLQFIEGSVLQDGSWPIDTNLATWVTSLTVRVLAAECEDASDAATMQSLVTTETIRWLLSCQHQIRHPFTGADPGGWGWTDLSGAVPDADDTPAAIIAIDRWLRFSQSHCEVELAQSIERAIQRGGEWLLNLQNRDGGWPTFCRGWGQLPFDRSGADLTAHAIRALLCVRERRENGREGERLLRRVDRAIERGLTYLKSTQLDDGAWLPLWFGNQDERGEENPIYGTSRVLLCLAELRKTPWSVQSEQLAQPAMDFLKKSQNRDGGWGGGASVNYPKNIRKMAGLMGPASTLSVGGIDADLPTASFSSSVEETALALEALLACDTHSPQVESIMSAVRWLSHAVEAGWIEVSWPIGFYFAKLWYHERSYPVIYSLAALNPWLARSAQVATSNTDGS